MRSDKMPRREANGASHFKRRIKMELVHLTSDNFEAEVLKADGTVLVDFWATWCGPCQMLAPIIEEIANELPDVKVCKLDVDENPDIAAKYNIMSIPSLFIYKNGEIVKRSIGVKSKDSIIELVTSV